MPARPSLPGFEIDMPVDILAQKKIAHPQEIEPVVYNIGGLVDDLITGVGKAGLQSFSVFFRIGGSEKETGKILANETIGYRLFACPVALIKIVY